VLERLTKLEKKAFPAYEAFLFDAKLLKQQKFTVMFLTQTQTDFSSSIQAYAVCVRFRQTMLLHDRCVAEPWRRKGFGKYLMDQILLRARSESCRYIEMWVDDSRVAARQLYLKCGFCGVQKASDYYRTGRHALKMALELES
jgi:GNAT superfamily N-acetyltransferase